METLVMSLTHIAVSYLLWVFNTLPPSSFLDNIHSAIPCRRDMLKTALHYAYGYGSGRLAPACDCIVTWICGALPDKMQRSLVTDSN